MYHAATKLGEDKLLIFGGNAPLNKLADDNLYLLSTYPRIQWEIVDIEGIGPGSRYGHAMWYDRPYFIVFGGNDQQKVLNDCYVVNMERRPRRWTQLNFERAPCPRYFHTVCVVINRRKEKYVMLGGLSEQG